MQQRSSKVPDKFSVPMYRPDELKGIPVASHMPPKKVDLEAVKARNDESLRIMREKQRVLDAEDAENLAEYRRERAKLQKA